MYPQSILDAKVSISTLNTLFYQIIDITIRNPGLTAYAQGWDSGGGGISDGGNCCRAVLSSGILVVQHLLLCWPDIQFETDSSIYVYNTKSYV